MTPPRPARPPRVPPIGTAAPRAARLRVPLSDLHGAAQLTTDAVLGVTALVEAMHAGIARVPVGPVQPKTRGITGQVYGSVRGVTRLAGGAVTGALRWAAQRGGAAPDETLEASGPRRDAMLSALNAAVGDHLAATVNPLALPLVLRLAGRTLAQRAEPLAQALRESQPQVTGRLLVLVHGLGMNDRQWQQRGHDHGRVLASAGGYTAVYVRYNTGLPVHANGAALAERLQDLLAAWPVPLERVVLLGHSMGGLVARSALHQARPGALASVTDLVCLGTPHHGAPLERAGHLVDRVLGAAPYAAPLARLGKVRSAGVVDLRHGRVRADDQPAPLPAGVRCHAVAAALGEPGHRMKAAVLGDGLVPLDSALGRHADPARHLAFEPHRQAVFHGMGHLALLWRPEVRRALADWLI